MSLFFRFAFFFVLILASCGNGSVLRRTPVPTGTGAYLASLNTECEVTAWDGVFLPEYLFTNAGPEAVRTLDYRFGWYAGTNEIAWYSRESFNGEAPAGYSLRFNPAPAGFDPDIPLAALDAGEDAFRLILEFRYLDTKGATNAVTAATIVRMRGNGFLLDSLRTPHFLWRVRRDFLQDPELRRRIFEATNYLERVHDTYLRWIGDIPGESEPLSVIVTRNAPLFPNAGGGDAIAYTKNGMFRRFFNLTREVLNPAPLWSLFLGEAANGVGAYTIAHEYVHDRLFRILPTPPYWFIEPPAILLGMQMLENEGEKAMFQRTDQRMREFDLAFRERKDDLAAIFRYPLSEYPSLNGSDATERHYGRLVEFLRGLEKTGGPGFLRRSLDTVKNGAADLPPGCETDAGPVNTLLFRAFTNAGGEDVARYLLDNGFPAGAETNRQ